MTLTLEDVELLGKLNELYFQARTRKRRYYEEWRRNYLLLNNKMWSEWRTSNWMPSPTSSEIYPIVAALIAWMTDQLVVFSVSSATDPHTLYAQYINKLANDLQDILQSGWINHDQDHEIELMLWDAATYGSGIMKTVWDAGAVDGLGDALIRRIDPWAIYPDPNCTSLDDAQYVVEVNRLSYDEIKRRYPMAYDEIIAAQRDLEADSAVDIDQRPQMYDTETFPKTNPGAMPQAVGSTTYGLPGQGRQRAVLTPGVTVKEYWIRETVTEPIEHSPQKEKPNPTLDYPEDISYDEWRVVVEAAGYILMDERASDLWSTGRHPYARFCYDDIGEFWGIALVSHLAPAQIAINRLLSSLQHNAELIGNPIFMEPDDSGISRTAIINRPGQRLRLKGGPGSNPNNQPGWLTPPEMPQFIQQLIQFWINRMENISGLGQTSKGNLPPPRTPSSSVTATQESGFVRIRSAMRNLEDCLRIAGELQVNLITENYTTPRIVAIVGESGQQTALQLATKHFYDPTGGTPFRFAILVDAGANNPTSRQSRIAESDTLFALHAIDQQALLEAHNYPNWMDIVQRMRQDALGQFMQQQLGAGKRVKAARST